MSPHVTIFSQNNLYIILKSIGGKSVEKTGIEKRIEICRENAKKINSKRYKCKFCSKEFTKPNLVKHEPACKLNPKNIKHCLNCGEIITSKTSDKFCSQSCSASYNNVRKKPKEYKKLCSRCGEEFIIKGHKKAAIKVCGNCSWETCVVCGDPLPEDRKKLHARTCYRCKKKSRNIPRDAKTKEKRNASLLRRKKKLVELNGGKCSICGYAKNLAALDFHHVKEKTFNLNTAAFEKHWDTLLEEAKKCILVCANCHHEIHNKDFDEDKLKSLLRNLKISSKQNSHCRTKRRDLLKRKKLIGLKGGECSICGYKKNLTGLEFHHEKGKDFSLSRTGLCRPWKKILKEAEKCILLCSTCHREHHFPQCENN